MGSKGEDDKASRGGGQDDNDRDVSTGRGIAGVGRMGTLFEG
jgi:hypothetical protein